MPQDDDEEEEEEDDEEGVEEAVGQLLGHVLEQAENFSGVRWVVGVYGMRAFLGP